MLKAVDDAIDNVKPIRTDVVVAAEIRADLTPLLDQVCAIMTKARNEGYEVSWLITPDSFGRQMRCNEIAIRKPL